MNKIILLVLLLLNKFPIYSCDFCNCYMGLNPKYKSNLIGLRYSSMYSEGNHKMGTDISHSEVNMKMKKEEYDLYGQIIPLDKFQIYFTIPYIISKQEVKEKISETHIITHHDEAHTFVYNHTESSDQIYSGIGDPIIIFHYQLINNVSSDSSKYNFRLLAGAGIKFPIGEWKLNPTDPHQSRSHLPGSGSWDYLSSLRYLSQYKKFGFNVNSNFMFTTQNNESFKFGNRFNLNGTFLYTISKNQFTFYPNAGLYFESAGYDRFSSNTINDSGGNILFYHAGIDFYFKKFSVNTAVQIPSHENLKGVQPNSKSKFMAGISYVIG